MNTKPTKPSATDDDIKKQRKKQCKRCPILESRHTEKAMICAANWGRMLANILWDGSCIKIAIDALQGPM